jgi:hypothetical protein
MKKVDLTEIQPNKVGGSPLEVKNCCKEIWRHKRITAWTSRTFHCTFKCQSHINLEWLRCLIEVMAWFSSSSALASRPCLCVYLVAEDDLPRISFNNGVPLTYVSFCRMRHKDKYQLNDFGGIRDLFRGSTSAFTRRDWRRTQQPHRITANVAKIWIEYYLNVILYISITFRWYCSLVLNCGLFNHAFWVLNVIQRRMKWQDYYVNNNLWRVQVIRFFII